MITKKTIPVFLLLLVAAVVFLLLPNDEQKIRNNLSSLAEYCSTAQQDAILAAVKKARQTAKLCTIPCRVSIDSFKIDRDLNQKEIGDHILMMKQQLPATSFSFHDTHIDIPDEKNGTIITTLRLSGSNVTGRFSDAYELNITVRKDKGKWLFSSFHVVEFMEQ